MARAGYIEQLLAGLPSDHKRVLKLAFEYVLDNLRHGRPDDGSRAENGQAYFFEGTTPGVANTEFSIAHGLGSAPYLLIPVLPLDVVNARIVPLKVTRAADSERIYLSSSEINAYFRVMVEA